MDAGKIRIAWPTLAIMLLFFSGCVMEDGPRATENNITATTTTQAGQTQAAPATEGPAVKPEHEIKVEVYHFHPTQQCPTCIALGSLAEKTVNTYFQKELWSGKLVFGHININEAQNAELVKKYEVTGSSLWIGTYVDGKFYKEENVNVWYKVNDEQAYLSYLKGVIDKRLKGDLSE